MIRKLLSAILVVFCIVLAPVGSLCAGGDQSMLVSVGAGTSEFVVQGESFRIITPQSLSVIFEGVSAERIWGRIVLDGDATAGSVHLVWNRHGQPPVSLHNGPVLEHEVPFDSEECTGHNEK